MLCSVKSVFTIGAQVCVLAFSTIDADSFHAIEKWKAKVNIMLQP